MRLGILSVIAVCLLATSVAKAQPEGDEAPASRQPLPSASGEPIRSSGPAMPAWQAPPGGYGGWYGDYGDCCGGCCNSCDSCCHKCRPGLICRLKMLKCKMCAKWACRRSCRSCCSSCSSCCGDCCADGAPPHGMPMAPSHGDLLPVPPAESATYDADADYSMARPSPHRPASAKTSLKKQRYSMPQVHSASKTTPKSKKKKAAAASR